jgi:hypothetical protein
MWVISSMVVSFLILKQKISAPKRQIQDNVAISKNDSSALIVRPMQNKTYQMLRTMECIPQKLDMEIVDRLV